MALYNDRYDINDNTIIYHRPGAKDDYWQCRVAIGGKHYRKTTKEKSKARAIVAAEKIWVDICTRLATGRPITPKTVSVVAEALIAEWRAEIDSPRTKAEIKTRLYNDILWINNKIVPLLGNLEIDTITMPDISAYTTALKKQHLSASSINNSITALARLLDYAESQRLITNAQRPKLPRSKLGINNVERRGAFSHEQMSIILANIFEVATDHIRAKARDRRTWYELYYYIKLLTATGLRPSSAIRLYVADVRIRTKYGANHFVINATTHKGDHPIQKIIIPDFDAADGFLNYLYTDKKDGEGKRIERPKNEKLFSYTAPHYSRHFNEILAKLKLTKTDKGEPLTVYSVRHYYISQAVKKGHDPVLLAKNTLTSVQMIQTYYEHSNLEQHYEILSTINRQMTPNDEEMSVEDYHEMTAESLGLDSKTAGLKISGMTTNEVRKMREEMGEDPDGDILACP